MDDRYLPVNWGEEKRMFVRIIRFLGKSSRNKVDVLENVFRFEK